MVIGDFDKDGNEDLAVTNYDSKNVAILLGEGDGSFQAALFIETFLNPISIVVSDFDNDGNEDLAVALDRDSDGGVIAVFMSQGDGSFVPGGLFYDDTDMTPKSIAVGDFDKDGNKDIVLILQNNQREGAFAILTGRGDGAFDLSLFYDLGRYPNSVAVGDLNGDGNEDLAMATSSFSWQRGYVAIFIGEGDGSFNEVSPCHEGYVRYSVAIDDFNGDGNQDLVVGGGGVFVILGHGDGSFESEGSGHPGVGGAMIAIGDFNGDGNEDVAGLGEGNIVSIVIGKGDGSLTTASYYESGGFSIAVGDFDSDGNQDLASVGFDVVTVFMGVGDGSFGEASFYLENYYTTSIVVGDFNEDSHQDLAVAGDSVFILFGTGDGGFGDISIYGAGDYSLGAIAVGDFNEDGHQDLTVTSLYSVGILLGLGNGTFSEATYFGAGDRPVSIAVGDFNEDGHEDLAVADGWNHHVAILLGMGIGYFFDAAFYEAGGSPRSIAVGDFREDGHQDLAVATGGGDGVAILQGNGSGSFQYVRCYLSGSSTYSVAVGDLDKDGHEDLAVPGNAVAILKGMGDGRFSDPLYYGPMGRVIALGDFDHNGNRDIAIGYYAGFRIPHVSILINNSATVGVESPPEGKSHLPKAIALSQNYPNPFNPSTTIAFDITGPSGYKQAVSLIVYDIRGRRVKILVDSKLEPGSHVIHWDGRNDGGGSVSSGIYLYTLRTGGEAYTRKMSVLK
jgi:hypothetical protein